MPEEIKQKEDKKIGTLIYCGQIDIDKNDHYYYVMELSKNWGFKKALIPGLSIGSIIKCELTESGVKGPYLLQLERSNHNDIAEWTAKDKAHTIKQQLVQANKKEHPADIQRWIDKIKDSTRYLSTREKRLLALRIYTELLPDSL